MEKNKSSGGETVQRIYSAIGGVPGTKEDPRTAGWQVAKWLLSALLLLLPFLLFQRSTEHKRAGYFTFLFVRLCIFLVSFVWAFFLIFGLSFCLARSVATECGFTPVDDPLIY